jgi:DNA-directed RNA polymerase specialized sigma24 family protein
MEPWDSQSIERLAQRLREGDREALADVWRWLGEDLRRRARTRLRQYGIAGQAESMDICNAVLTDLAKQGQINLQRADDLPGYVMRAIDNEVRDVFRQLSRERRDFRRVEPQPVEEHRVAQDAHTASQALLRREILDRVRSEIGPQHEAIVDLVLAGHEWSEIGSILKIAADTARMRYRRALAKVRDQLGVPGEGSPS